MARRDQGMCDTGLVLRLGFGRDFYRASRDHHKEDSLAMERIPSEPSLTLSLSDDSSKVVISSFSFKKEKDVSGGGDDTEAAEDEDEVGAGAKKKLRLTKDQSALLEERFKEHSTLNPKQKQNLAKQLNLRPRQVEVWFQNRRARSKLKQTEVDCELLKKCCETLTDENRRLQKELQELKAIKHAPPTIYVQPPAATLRMCPSCQRIAGEKDAGEGAAGRFVIAPKPHLFNPFTHPAAC